MPIRVSVSALVLLALAIPALLIIGLVLLGLLQTLPKSSPGRGSFRSFAVVVTGFLLLYFVTPYIAAWLRFLQWFRALALT